MNRLKGKKFIIFIALFLMAFGFYNFGNITTVIERRYESYELKKDAIDLVNRYYPESEK